MPSTRVVRSRRATLVLLHRSAVHRPDAWSRCPNPRQQRSLTNAETSLLAHHVRDLGAREPDPVLALVALLNLFCSVRVRTHASSPICGGRSWTTRISMISVVRLLLDLGSAAPTGAYPRQPRQVSDRNRGTRNGRSGPPGQRPPSSPSVGPAVGAGRPPRFPSTRLPRFDFSFVPATS